MLVELTQKSLDILSIKVHGFPLQVKFEIYDSDGNSKNLNKKDYMGKKEVNLDTIVQQKRLANKRILHLLDANLV